MQAARPPGEPLSRYELREEIAHGGEGIVYYGWDRDLERDVAIKLPNPDRSANPDFIARFLNEARVCARLQRAFGRFGLTKIVFDTRITTFPPRRFKIAAQLFQPSAGGDVR